MLHNSGPYGPNDVPVNMGMPVNMTQMSNPMNLGNNLGNLAKMPQQAPQTATAPYNMPDYSSFGHPPLNIGHPMSPFANYQHVNFQATYGRPTSHLQHNSDPGSVQNSMQPMNLNIQSDNGSCLMNYQNIESKKIDISNMHYRENFNRKMPINIPQIHTKAFHKQLGMDTDCSQYNSVQENPLYSHNLSKTLERPLIDSSRKKSLENTVKLIENILVNSTPKDKLQDSNGRQSFIQYSDDVRNKRNNEEDNTKKPTENVQISHNISVNNPSGSVNVTDIERTNTELKTTNTDIHDSSTIDIKLGLQDTSLTDSGKSLRHYINQNTIDSIEIVEKSQNTQSEIHCERLRPNLINNHSKSKEPQNWKGPDESVEEVILEVEIKKEVEDEIEEIENAKVEPQGGFDNVPFLKDGSAVHRNVIEADAVIVQENIVAEAQEAMQKGSNPKTYYECCHCKLLFKHPKRFLIHTKWHSFGQTTEKLHELAREKELKKSMKKEARIIERLNSKELKEGAEKVHPCKDCDKVFPGKSSLKNHRQKHHPTRVRECKICKVSVVGWMQLRAHMTAHTGGNGYQCGECPKRFKYAHSLAKHKDTHLEKTHGCEQCEKKFGSQALLKMHMKCHERTARGATFRCTYCGKGFFESYNLQCEKKFGSQALLKMHMKCHERTARGATFRCTYCGKGFFESYNLQVHERTHRNERPFQCDICKSSFGTNSSLKRHVKVSHSTLKPFPCPTCHRCFASATTRARHSARAHADLDSRLHACAHCSRRYSTVKELRKHVSKSHGDSAE